MAAEAASSAIPRTKAPVRLIDIAATLATEGGVCFCDPNAWPPAKRWDFHVLSHTWSKLLKNFSKTIGDNAAGMGLTSSEGYNEAFRNAHLQNEKCYQEFRKVLDLLRGDGVEYVWYDMFCINQADPDEERGEKAQEIPFMASYYHYNKGCYVLLHGVGQGYRLWNKPPPRIGAVCSYWKGSRASVPRWFTRVWTFQEYVLPSRLIFIVEGLERSTKAHLNHFIRTFSKSAHDPNLLMMCCCVATTSRFIDVDSYRKQLHRMDVKAKQAEKEQEVLGACDHTKSCYECGITEPLIRKVKDKENLYFVNEKAYMLLVDLDWGKSASHQREFFNTLMHLHLLATDFSYQDGRVEHVIHEIIKRNSTVEEDRVLSILGLLQVRGDKQVRTKKTLEVQLRKLPKKLVEAPKILLQLCWASQEGGFYNDPGLSWAPNLTFPSIKDSFFDFPKFPLNKFLVDDNVVIKPMPKGHGCLLFRGKVVKGRIVPLPRHHVISHKQLPTSCLFCRNFRNHPFSSLILHQIVQCHLEVGDKIRLLLDVHFFFVHTEKVQGPHKAHVGEISARGLVEVANSWFDSTREEDAEVDEVVTTFYDCSFALNVPHMICVHTLPSLDVWILHIGSSQMGLDTFYLNFLICLGTIGTNAKHGMHKVGTLSLSNDLWDMALNFNQDLVKECILGGFGKNHIHKLWRALAKPPYTCNQCQQKTSLEPK